MGGAQRSGTWAIRRLAGIALLCLLPFAAGCGPDTDAASSATPTAPVGQTVGAQEGPGQTPEATAIMAVEVSYSSSLDVWRARLQQQWGGDVTFAWSAAPGAADKWRVKLVIRDAKGREMSGAWSVVAPMGGNPTPAEVQDWLELNDEVEARPLDRGARMLVGLPPSVPAAGGEVRLPVTLMGETAPGQLLVSVVPEAMAPLVRGGVVDDAMLRGLELAGVEDEDDLASLTLRLDEVRFTEQGTSERAARISKRRVLERLTESGPQEALITWTGVRESATLDDLQRRTPREVALPRAE